MNFDKDLFVQALENQVTTSSASAIQAAVEKQREEAAKVAAQRVADILAKGSDDIVNDVATLRSLRKQAAAAKIRLTDVGRAKAWADKVAEDGELRRLVPLLLLTQAYPQSVCENLGLVWDEVKDTQIPDDFDPNE